MASLDFKAFDADNHYYEAEDAFIRHVDPKMHKRCMQWAEINGRGVQQVDSRRLGILLQEPHLRCAPSEVDGWGALGRLAAASTDS